MIKTVSFKPEHMVNIEKADMDSKALEFIGDIDSRAEYYAQSGPAITMLEPSGDTATADFVLAIGGVIKYWEGVGEGWMMVSPEGRKKVFSLYKTVDSFLQACADNGYHRIQTCVLVGYKDAHRLVMKLGFIPEGMMVNYGPNKENYIRYVRL